MPVGAQCLGFRIEYLPNGVYLVDRERCRCMQLSLVSCVGLKDLVFDTCREHFDVRGLPVQPLDLASSHFAI